jgi:hypothetical protein
MHGGPGVQRNYYEAAQCLMLAAHEGEMHGITPIILQIPAIGLPKQYLVLMWECSKSKHEVLPAGVF